MKWFLSSWPQGRLDTKICPLLTDKDISTRAESVKSCRYMVSRVLSSKTDIKIRVEQSGK